MISRSWIEHGLLALALLGCSGSESSPAAPATATGGSTTGGGPQASGGSIAGGVSSSSGGVVSAGGVSSGGSLATGGATGAGAPSSGSSAGGAAAGASSGGTGGGGASSGGATSAVVSPPDAVALPPGSRELDGVVNLVDAEAARELDDFLLNEERIHQVLRQRLTKSFNAFVARYTETYDFLVFITDHPVPESGLAGKFEAINQNPVAGGSPELQIAAGGYRSKGRTRGISVVPYEAGFLPPLSHEAGHFWGNYLDERFPFGTGLTAADAYPVHWGYSDVNGQLGGFDGSTLRCETPAAALPPDCTPLASGRTRYLVGNFGPNANAFRHIPFSGFELYLMGLVPANEVPQSFRVLTQGAIDPASFDDAAQDDLVVEASGVTTVTLAEIQARHGVPPLLSESERNFSAAFVVFSAEPAPDALLREVADWAAVWGNRRTISGWSSFESNTLGRARMNTALGPRRSQSDPAPPPRVRFECDVVAQDCGSPELGCHWPPALCARSRGIARGEACDGPFACAPGHECMAPTSDPGNFRCIAYCDPDSAGTPKSCDTVCPGKEILLQGDDGTSHSVCPP